MNFNWLEIGHKVAVFYMPFLFALCFHEFAHGWVAKRKGDDTAEIMGRLTMNPLAHMDFLGTFVLPLFAIISGIPFFFGWAKPVPVNSRNLSKPKEDMFWIALAGPLSNVLLAVISFICIIVLLKLETGMEKMVVDIFSFFLIINLFLAFFNMLPLHPLDGGKVMARFLPHNWNRWLEDNQQMLNIALLALFFTGGFRYLAIPVHWLGQKMIHAALAVSL